MRDVTFRHLSPDMIGRIKQKMLGHFEGKEHENQGELIVKGVHVKYSIGASDNSLTVSVINVPQIVTAGYVIGQLYDEIEKLSQK